MNFSQRNRIAERLKVEQGAFRKNGCAIRIGLAYPNQYFFGMSNLGFQVLYHIFNQDPEIACERFFLPESDVLPEVSRGSLTGYEQSSQGRDLGMVAFSISYQNDYLNVVPMLYLLGLKSLASERDEKDPLILAGGPAVTINPEPIAPFCDAIVVGEGEEIAVQILEILKSIPDKAGRLVALDRLEGVYVPSLFPNAYEQLSLRQTTNSGFGLISGAPNGKPQAGRFVRRLVVQDPTLPLAHTTVLTPDTEFGDLFLLEVQRGCQWGCRFCAAGFMYRYPRYEALEGLKRRIDLGLKYRKKVGLIAGDLLGHETIHEILAYIDEKGGGFSPSSVRLNAFTPEIIHYLRKSGNRSIAIAPEAGSERLRRALNKTFSDAEVIESAVLLAEGGISNIKLYIMIGLPTETDEDIESLLRLTLETREALSRFAKKSGHMPSLTLSISPFTPKSSTPLQHEAFAGIPYLKSVFKKIRQRVMKAGHIRLSGESALNAYVETLLSRGDRRVSEFLLKATVSLGKAISAGDYADQRSSLNALSFNPDSFVTSRLDPNLPQPWDFIDHGIKSTFLTRELDKFHREKITHYCMPDVCRSCGVC